MASISAPVSRSVSGWPSASGGMRITVSPSGRSQTPRLRAAAQTAAPVRSPTLRTSTPVIVPRRRISSTPSWFSRGLRSCPMRSPRAAARATRPRSSISLRLALAAAQHSGLAVYVWPWKKVRPLAAEPRNDSYTSSVVRTADSGRDPPVRPLAGASPSGTTPPSSAPPGVLDRQRRAGAADAGGDLVADEQRTVPRGQPPGGPQEVRVVREHPGRGLHHRLDDDRADPVTVPGHRVGHLLGRLDRARGRG